MKVNFTLKQSSYKFVSPVKNRLLLLLLLTYFNVPIAMAQIPVKEWDQTYGGNYTDELQIIVPTENGGYLLGGSSASDVGGDKSQPNRNSLDFWVLMIDAEGNKLWDKTYGGNKVEVLRDMIATPDGGYLLGGESYSGKSGDKSDTCRGGEDYWVVKIDKNGNKLWDKSFGGKGYDVLTSMVVASDGNVLIGGHSSSGKGFEKSQASKGENDFWILMINSDGSKLWDKTIGGNSSDDLSDIILTSDGGFLLGGSSYSEMGGEKSESSILHDYWVVKINNIGGKEWDKTYVGNSTDGLSIMTAHPDGGFLLGGFSYSNSGADKSNNNHDAEQWNTDHWLIYISDTGEKIWDKTIGGTDTEWLRSLLITPDNHILLGGPSYSGKGANKTEENKGDGADFWIVKLDTGGNIVWDKTFGGTAEDDLYSVVPTSDGGYLLGGTSDSVKGGDKTEDGWHTLGFDFWVLKVREQQHTITSKDDSFQAYPTLFSQSTNVEFTLPASENYRLELYDGQGRQVSIIDQGHSKTGQTLKHQIPAGDLKDGIYYLKLQTTSKSTTLRLLLQK